MNRIKNPKILKFPSSITEAEREVEAILFSAEEPLDIETIQSKINKKINIIKTLELLKKQYENRGINLINTAGRWSFRTARNLKGLMNMQKSIQKKLSKAAIETLAIIVYHQPVTRAEIEEVRGVSASPGTIDTLLELNWIKIKGRRKVPGNPITYGTTDEFLVHFDLESIKDLPDMEELKSTGLLDNNLPPEIYPENNINNDIINNEDDINNEEGLKD